MEYFETNHAGEVLQELLRHLLTKTRRLQGLMPQHWQPPQLVFARQQLASNVYQKADSMMTALEVFLQPAVPQSPAAEVPQKLDLSLFYDVNTRGRGQHSPTNDKAGFPSKDAVRRSRQSSNSSDRSKLRPKRPNRRKGKSTKDQKVFKGLSQKTDSSQNSSKKAAERKTSSQEMPASSLSQDKKGLNNPKKKNLSSYGSTHNRSPNPPEKNDTIKPKKLVAALLSKILNAENKLLTTHLPSQLKAQTPTVQHRGNRSRGKNIHQSLLEHWSIGSSINGKSFKKKAYHPVVLSQRPRIRFPPLYHTKNWLKETSACPQATTQKRDGRLSLRLRKQIL
jgi:hypothetical protein